MFQSLWYRAIRLLISYEPVSEILRKKLKLWWQSHKLRWRTSRKINLKQCIQSIVAWLAFHFLFFQVCYMYDWFLHGGSNSLSSLYAHLPQRLYWRLAGEIIHMPFLYGTCWGCITVDLLWSVYWITRVHHARKLLLIFIFFK